jgi:hypothetical protein
VLPKQSLTSIPSKSHSDDICRSEDNKLDAKEPDSEAKRNFFLNENGTHLTESIENILHFNYMKYYVRLMYTDFVGEKRVSDKEFGVLFSSSA